MRSAARRLFRRQAVTTTTAATTITTTTSSTHRQRSLLSSLFVRHFMTETTKENSTFVSPSKILVSYDPSTANEHLSELLKEKDITRSVESRHRYAVIGFDTETRPTFSKVAKKNKVAGAIREQKCGVFNPSGLDEWRSAGSDDEDTQRERVRVTRVWD